MARLSWTLTLPSPGVVGSADERLRMLGKDIFFDGDYSVTGAGDYATLDGLEALKQAIYNRLICRPGEFRLRPDYGVGIMSFVKKRRIQAELDDMKGKIIDQLSLDPRIDEVTNVTVERIDDGVKIGLIIRAAGETLRFRPFNFTEKQLITLGG